VTSTVICSHLPIPNLGLIVLRLDWTGAPGDGEVQVLRRIVGDTTTETVVIPAAGLGPHGGGLTAGGTLVMSDTTAPLDTAVEYLTAPWGESTYTTSSQVTLDSQGYWWLGDPLIPGLDIQVSVTTTTAVRPCASQTGVFLLSLGSQVRTGRSLLTESDATGERRHTSIPRLGEEGQIILATRQLSDLDTVSLILNSGNVVCLRAPGATTYGVDTSYLHIGDVQTGRLGTDMRRTWRMVTLATAQVLLPSGSASAQPCASWEEVCLGAYATYADLTTDDVTYTNTSMGQVGGSCWPSTYPTSDDVATTYATCALLAAAGLTCIGLATGV
jgi:hypothetical protein